MLVRPGDGLRLCSPKISSDQQEETQDTREIRASRFLPSALAPATAVLSDASNPGRGLYGLSYTRAGSKVLVSVPVSIRRDDDREGPL